MPATSEVTVPLPLPFLTTLSRLPAGPNSALTDLAAAIVTSQAPDPLHAPDQAFKAEPGSGFATSVTNSFSAYSWEQVEPQVIPASLTLPSFELTVPVPLPDLVTARENFGDSGP